MLSIKAIKTKLVNHEYDDKLSELYCRKGEELNYYRERISEAMDAFMRELGYEEDTNVCICSAPGRTEIGGNHTDHQRGRVLTASVDLNAIAVAAAGSGSVIRIYSEGYGLTCVDICDLNPIKEEENSTNAIIRGVAAGVKNRGYDIGGFDAYVTSDVPGGSGLSSSACFEILMGTLMNRLFCNDELKAAEIASIGQYAENVYFGKPSGLLDQMGCAMGGIVAIDFKDKDDPKYKSVDFDFESAGHALCIIDTGANHADLTDDYAAVTSEMKSVANFFGMEVLSEIDEGEFYEQIPKLREKAGDRAVLRAMHFFSDCRRVDEQLAALESGDFNEFLRLVNDSGNSSFMFLQNVETYRDPMNQPVALALGAARHYLENRGAVRVHGGGFAGTIQAYVPFDLLDEFKKSMDAMLGEGACRITFIRPAGGTCIC